MADNQEQFFSFEEALDQLRLKEEELKRLVSEGEIRAFRDGETMKLRVTDVESLRSELGGGEVVELGEAGEELVFEDDDDLAEAGMATEEISEMDTLLDDDVEDVGEIELEELEGLEALDDPFEDVDVDEEELEETAPTRRVGAAAAATAADDDQTESTGMRFLMIATAVVLTMTLPVMLAVSTGYLSELARGIGGLLGEIPD